MEAEIKDTDYESHAVNHYQMAIHCETNSAARNESLQDHAVIPSNFVQKLKNHLTLATASITKLDQKLLDN